MLLWQGEEVSHAMVVVHTSICTIHDLHFQKSECWRDCLFSFGLRQIFKSYISGRHMAVLWYATLR